MKRYKARFKYALGQPQYNEESLRADELASKMMNKNYDSFWKDIKHVHAAKVSLTDNIGDIYSANCIVNMWKDHYSKMYII